MTEYIYNFTFLRKHHFTFKHHLGETGDIYPHLYNRVIICDSGGSNFAYPSYPHLYNRVIIMTQVVVILLSVLSFGNFKKTK